MKVTVRGISGQYHTLELSSGTDVALLRERLEDLEGVGAENIVLVYSGQELLDGYPLANYSLHEYNLAGEPLIYMQASVPEKMPIFLAARINHTRRITEYVPSYATLANVIDLLHDHRLTGGIDVETCRFITMRTTGTTITDANFVSSTTVLQALMALQRTEGRRVRHLTFLPAPDGNVHIIADYCAEKQEQTILHPRPTMVRPAISRARKEGEVTLEDMKKELCVNEYSHPPHPVLFGR